MTRQQAPARLRNITHQLNGGHGVRLGPLGMFVVAVFCTVGWPCKAALADSADASLHQLVDKHLGIFLVKPALRDPDSTIRLAGQTLKIRLRREVPNDQRLTQFCQWARWLLTGRLEKTNGAQALFTARRDIERIEVTVYSVRTSVEPARDQGYRQHRHMTREALLAVTRGRAAQLDRTSLRKNLSGFNCTRLVRRILDEAWLRGDL
ncbi:MAG: hypothetical protein VX589_10725 [Myxococcota bacterium]|nr:hypothetical protein [Myxococcota bacterium]